MHKVEGYESVTYIYSQLTAKGVAVFLWMITKVNIMIIVRNVNLNMIN